jgi:hypothetical protein
LDVLHEMRAAGAATAVVILAGAGCVVADGNEAFACTRPR